MCDQRCGTSHFHNLHCNWRGLGNTCRFCFNDDVPARIASEIALARGSNVIMYVLYYRMAWRRVGRSKPTYQGQTGDDLRASFVYELLCECRPLRAKSPFQSININFSADSFSCSMRMHASAASVKSCSARTIRHEHGSAGRFPTYVVLALFFQATSIRFVSICRTFQNNRLQVWVDLPQSHSKLPPLEV